MAVTVGMLQGSGGLFARARVKSCVLCRKDWHVFPRKGKLINAGVGKNGLDESIEIQPASPSSWGCPTLPISYFSVSWLWAEN